MSERLFKVVRASVTANNLGQKYHKKCGTFLYSRHKNVMGISMASFCINVTKAMRCNVSVMQKDASTEMRGE